MREVEQEGRVFNAGASYVKVRRVLVDFICEAGEELKLHGPTMHVAVSCASCAERGARPGVARRGLRSARARARTSACTVCALACALSSARTLSGARTRFPRAQTLFARRRALNSRRSAPASLSCAGRLP
jgi:hypothetical protein